MKTNPIISSSFIKLLVYANVFISICSLAQVFLTYHLYSIPFNFANNSYLVFIFLSTYLQYNMQRGYMINPQNASTERSQWLLKHKKLLLYSVGAALVTVMFLCNNLSWTSIGIMIGAEIVSTLYYLPPFNLRKHGYIKPFLISSVWVISCSVVPLIENHLLTINSLFFIAAQFLTLSVLCLLFDIKDAEDDYLLGVNTYANKFGVKITQLICAFCILLIFVCFKQVNTHLINLSSSLIFCFILLATVFLTKISRPNFYYYLWVDGLLIIETLIFVFI